MAEKFYFRCRSNPKAPFVVLNNYWEAKEMQSHPDYDRVDENGLPIANEEEKAEKRIPFQPAAPRQGR